METIYVILNDKKLKDADKANALPKINDCKVHPNRTPRRRANCIGILSIGYLLIMGIHEIQLSSTSSKTYKELLKLERSLIVHNYKSNVNGMLDVN